MISRLSAGVGLLALASGAAYAGGPKNDPLLDIIVINGARTGTALSEVETPDLAPHSGPDVVQLLNRTPGGARVGNGPLSGQAQYRGLFGARLNVRVDGQRFAPGGPNLMDPPLHYAPPPLVAALRIDRGVSPVSAGPGLAGGVDAILKRTDFATTDAVDYDYDLSTEGRTVDDSYAVGGILGAASETLRFNLLGSYEKGEDAAFPDGEIRPTRFERAVYGLSAGAMTGGQEISLDLRRQETGPSGNPPFPMDIRYFNTDFARIGYKLDFGDARLEANASYADVSHAMNNFDLRAAPADITRYRETFADATTYTADAALIVPVFGGEARLGADYESSEHDVTITNPNNASFFLNSLPDIEMERIGGFIEWSGAVSTLNAELGARIDTTSSRAAEAVLGSAVPTGPQNLAAVFNASDRDHDDLTVDAVARFWTGGEQFSFRLTIARKTRVAGYVERFAWLPTGASGGLADGNTYIGDQNLDPETAWIAETGFDAATQRFYFRPTVFFRRIDDYIQGVPFDATPGLIDSPVEMVSNMNGDATPLRFANVDARLYGLDFDAGVKLTERLRADATGSYVRGERRDIDDNLYRIQPPSLTAGLSWEEARWSLGVETRLVAKQDEVSATNSEEETDGYALLGLVGSLEPAQGVRFSVGVENLLDASYEDHLAGYNRAGGSDVPLGERLPGYGRSVFVRLSLAG